MKTYPHYAVWKDVFSDCWEVIRYDTSKHFVVVRTYRSETKARNACAELQQEVD